MHYKVAKNIFWGAFWTQVIGVSASLAGWYYLSATHDKLLWKIAIPIGIAYLCLLPGLFALQKVEDFKDPISSVINVVFYCFILADILWLSLLVYFTGGAQKSVFIPLFLLIPTIATNFFYWKKKRFWIVTILSMVSFVFLSYYYVSIDAQLKQREGSKLKQEVSELKQSKVPEFLSGACTGICILTAALCYYSINGAKAEFCKDNGQEHYCNRFHY